MIPKPPPAPESDDAASSPDYEPPRVEEDLPLEVSSLACTGFGPKQATPVPCGHLGS